MILNSFCTVVLCCLAMLPCVGVFGQTKFGSDKRFVPHVSIGWSNGFFTKQLRSGDISPKLYNTRQKSGISCSLGAVRQHRSKNKTFGLVLCYFANRTRYTYQYTSSQMDSGSTGYSRINNRTDNWYLGVPITWSLLNKKKHAPFYLGITWEPLIYIMSRVNRQVDSDNETFRERYWSYTLAPVSMIVACAVGYRYKLVKNKELLITLNNQFQPFSSFNILYDFYMHRHNVELGFTYSY